MDASGHTAVFKKYALYFKKGIRYISKHGPFAAFKMAVKFLKDKVNVSYKKWLKHNLPTKEELDGQRAYRFERTPLISVVVPLYRTPPVYLDAMIKSVREQTYADWELCLSDGSGPDSPLTDILRGYTRDDERIKVVFNDKALRISENTNAALHIATGEYIGFADHDDLLAPNALYECARVINDDPDVDMIYTDEDKVGMNGKKYFYPHFKPDFDIDMLRSMNYICHFTVVKRDLYAKVGDLNGEYDGAQDHDFILRCVEKTRNIRHIPKVLYHWRAHPDSTAMDPESKAYAYDAGVRALNAHYERTGIRATAGRSELVGHYRTKYEISGEPLISIIIPNRDHADDLKKCVDSVLTKSAYKNYELIIVENGSEKAATFSCYGEIKERCSRARVESVRQKEFNYAALNNFGVLRAKGEYLLFLNNDTEVISEDWLTELLGFCARDDVGAVGARLYYADGTIQHAGVILGLMGIANHAFSGFKGDDQGYFERIAIAQDYSAVTAACMMVKRSVFEKAGGFDEKFAVAFNDVDLCLRIREAGYLIVYNPYAELYHFESKSRGRDDTRNKKDKLRSESDIFMSRWGEVIKKGDPYYNPNLTLEKRNFGIRRITREKQV